MKNNEKGFTLIEVLIATAILSLTIVFYITFNGQSENTSNAIINYKTSTKIMEQMAQDIQLAPTSNFSPGSFTVYFNSAGKKLTSATGAFFSVDVTTSIYSKLNSLLEISCNIKWNQNGKNQIMHFRVLK